MKQVKTLADLEAMQPRERDAWFAERFGINANDVQCFTITDYGIAELKAEMVKLGYKWECQCDGNKHWFAFRKKTQSYIYECDNEIEATWKSAALALLAGDV